MACRKGALNLEQINALIGLVKRRPSIWNTEHEDYNDRSTIARAWIQIAYKLQLPEDLIRAKWKNLRDLFIREMKRTHVTDVADYRGKWKHFKKMSFIFKPGAEHSDGDSSESEVPSPEPYVVKIEPNDSPDSYVDPEDQDAADKQTLKAFNSDSVDGSELESEPPDKRSSSERPVDKRSLSKQPLDKGSSSERPLNKRSLSEQPLDKRSLSDQPLEKRSTPERPLDKRIMSEHESLDKKSLSEHEQLDQRRRVDVYTDEDCDLMFLKSLVPYFKVLKPIRKLVLRNKIQEMLLQEIS